MKIKLNCKNKKIILEVKKCNLFQRAKGLMFSRREKARALLFDFEKQTREPIHSLFVFFPFVAVWLDDKSRTLETSVVKPFKFVIKPRKSFKSLVEIPINRRYHNVTKILHVDNAKHL